MKLTDFESRVEFEIDPDVIVGIYDRKGYTEVRTGANDGYFAEIGKCKVVEPVVILDRLNKEKGNVQV